MKIKPQSLGILVMLLVLAAQVPFREGLALQESKTIIVTPCVHLEHEGQKYSLSYFGYKCSHDDYVATPESLYDSLFSWAFNAAHAKILSELDRYKIMARLATVDDRGKKGFSKGPCNYGPWADYEWAHHAGQAYYGVSDSLGFSQIVTDSLVKPFLRSGLAQKDPHMGLVFKESTKLSRSKKSQLVQLLANAEDVLSKEERLLAVPLTLDEAAKQIPAYEEARRKTFQRFRIIHD